MDRIIERLENLKGSEVGKKVRSRLSDFSRMGRKSDEDIFSELCFCILTANYSAEGGIRIQDRVGKGFCSLSQEEMADVLKELGHRFPNKRAEFVHLAQANLPGLRKTISSFPSEGEAREWLVKNVKGLGYKEASHFLRNIGFRNLAIIDFHIIDLLVREGLIERPKSLTRKRYLEIEEVLGGLALRAGMILAELDLYLWYMETGKILK